MAELRDTLRQLAEEATEHHGPIRMINMIRYRDQAEYPADKAPADEPLTGQQAYARYRESAGVEVSKVGGSQVWYSSSNRTVIGPEDERWDAVFAVEYPSRQAFLNMVYSESYQAIAYHREAGVADSRLILTEPE